MGSPALFFLMLRASTAPRSLLLSPVGVGNHWGKGTFVDITVLHVAKTGNGVENLGSKAHQQSKSPILSFSALAVRTCCRLWVLQMCHTAHLWRLGRRECQCWASFCSLTAGTRPAAMVWLCTCYCGGIELRKPMSGCPAGEETLDMVAEAATTSAPLGPTPPQFHPHLPFPSPKGLANEWW